MHVFASPASGPSAGTGHRAATPARDSVWRRLLARVASARRARRVRRHLRTLDDRLLADIGIRREDLF